MLKYSDRKEDFFWKFHFSDSYLFIAAYYTPDFDISLHNFGPQSTQNCPFCRKEDFGGNFTYINSSHLLIVPYHAAEFEKKSLAQTLI